MDPNNIEYMKQVNNIWSMLDDMANSNPESYKKFIEKTLKEGKEEMKPPEFDMCVRTKSDENYLYINFFGWKKIPAPKTDDDPIPVFGKEIIKNKDNTCHVNLAFNKVVLEKYGLKANNFEERGLLIELAFNYVETHNKCEISRTGFIILEKCYGNLKECILNLNNNKEFDRKSEIEIAKEALGSIKLSNVNDNEEEMLNKISDNIMKDLKIGDSNEDSKKKVLIEEVKTEPSYETNLNEVNLEKYFEIKINLPKINSFSECDLNIESDNLTLVSNKNYYKELKLSLKSLIPNRFDILSDEIEAKFVKKSGILKIKIPLNLKI